MLKYLIIPLAQNAVSFCHYEKRESDDTLIPLETLEKALFWAMKENLNVQFLYPDTELSEDYKRLIDSIDHIDIVSDECKDSSMVAQADIIVLNSWEKLTSANLDATKSYVIRTSKKALFENFEVLKVAIKKANRLVVTFADIETFSDDDFAKYSEFLDRLIPVVKSEYMEGHHAQLNILTDRMFLDSMNNCSAGWESITFAPNGKFYVCPAFYLDGSTSIGDISSGPDIKNPQLFRLSHAPICRKCDSYQCRRCIWLNRKLTLEVNTPSHEQCVIAHIERNAAKKLLESIRAVGEFLPEKNISDINTLDPFDDIISQ